MFRVNRVVRRGRRKGEILPLTAIWRPIEVIPVFGRHCPANWTALSAVEEADDFYVNCFSDKDVYQTVY